MSSALSWRRCDWTAGEAGRRAELDHAQRRMIELNTAIPPLRLPPGRSSIDEFEALYALPSREPDDEIE